MRRIHLLALLVTLGGGASLLSPSPAAATYLPPPTLLEPTFNYCCKTYWGHQGCCGNGGCRIDRDGCTSW